MYIYKQKMSSGTYIYIGVMFDEKLNFRELYIIRLIWHIKCLD